MAQVQAQWVELDEFATMAAKMVEKYPERFGEIDTDKIIAYACVNKDRPESNKKPYNMTGAIPPESLTNSKTYFVKIFQDIWERTNSQKLALVFSALSRIDPSNPGKVRSLDYADQENMVDNFGANWHERGDLPDLLKDNVNLR